MNTRFYYHPLFLRHDTGPHPERPERLEAILAHLQYRWGEDLELLEPRKAALEDAALVHEQAYLESVERLCNSGGGSLDGDTPVSARSFDAALHAVGACLDGCDALVDGTAASAFALVRPPGHHARPARGMGFCLINNIAVGAAYLKARHHLERILIVDFDVHHGNGTQEMFYHDPSVYFLSIHRYPFYPGTGHLQETGEGPGKGKTRNLPVPFGLPAQEYLDAFTAALKEASKDHAPQLILVSAGFDAFEGDPIGGLDLLPEHFGTIGRAIKEIADRTCGGKILSTLEGGYALSGMPLCLDAYLEGIG